MNTQDIIRLAQRAKLRLVRFQYCDSGGILRCKATHVNRLARRMQEGIGQTLAMGAWSGVETLAEVASMGAIGEFRLMPDPDTFAVLPYAPNTGSMFCNWISLNGQLWEADPRYCLKRLKKRYAELGMRVEAALEHEFYFAREEMGRYVPADNSPCYSTAGMDEHAEVMDTILEALERQDLAIEQVHTEWGPGQQEISIQHSDVLRAADNACRVRETVRGVARQFGLLATFAPKPFLDLPGGNGAHIHLSIWGTDESEFPGRNLFYEPSQDGALSQTGLYFIGGVLCHIRGLVALTCGSVNSYERLQPQRWSSAYGAWGFDNREAAVRVPSAFWGREAESVNLELKCADHSGNPYLALSGLLAAGMDGIANEIEPGEPLYVDPGTLDEHERAAQNIKSLPTSLDEALNELEQDKVLMETLGPILAPAYLAIKRSEIAYFQDKTPEEIVAQHFNKY